MVRDLMTKVWDDPVLGTIGQDLHRRSGVY